MVSEELKTSVQYVDRCPRCGNDDFSPGAEYCKRCALRRVNTCTSDECGAVTPMDAAYCETCGHETYYHVEGAVAAWRPDVDVSYDDDVPF